MLLVNLNLTIRIMITITRAEITITKTIIMAVVATSNIKIWPMMALKL